MCTVDVFSFLFLDDKDSCLYGQMFGDNKNNNCFTDGYFTYIKFQVLLNNFSCLHVFFLKIIGDRRKKSGEYEFGVRFYTTAQKKGAYTLADEWWLIQSDEIKKLLKQPHIEKISQNRKFYYFDDYEP